MDWLSILSTGTVLLGLTQEETLDLTPAQFAAMCQAYHQERKILDTQLAWVRLLLAEPYRNRKQRSAAYHIDEFMMWADNGDANQKTKTQTPEEQLAYVKNFLHPYMEARHELLQKKGLA